LADAIVWAKWRGSIGAPFDAESNAMLLPLRTRLGSCDYLSQASRNTGLLRCDNLALLKKRQVTVAKQWQAGL
jgi:hypothetical protein